MHNDTRGHGRTRLVGRRGGVVSTAASVALAVAASAGTALSASLPASAATTSTTTSTASAGTGATVVSAETTPYGKALVVGSGPFAGYTLYQFDKNTPEACSTIMTPVQKQSISCTGPETDKTADWPALTTVGKPVAGPGVDKHLLGSLHRTDIGADQVTYAGKLLYMFDPAAHQFTGVNFMETALPLPPWHGVWWLVSPDKGLPVTGPTPVTTQKQPDGATVLAVTMFQGQGSVPIIVYSDSKDTKDHSTCTGTCALTWIPVRTSAAPQAGPGVAKSALGEIHLTDGTEQLTFDGKPLYFYSSEVPQLDPATGNPLDPATIGTGNGMHGPAHFGGTFSLVAAPATA